MVHNLQIKEKILATSSHVSNLTKPLRYGPTIALFLYLAASLVAKVMKLQSRWKAEISLIALT
jgi:hypothetical protein